MDSLRNNALSLLRDFVFPLREKLLQVTEDADCDSIVSLHKHNEINPGGFSVNDGILKIDCADSRNSGVVVQIERNLRSLDYIRLETTVRSKISSRSYTVDIKFFLDGYTVSKLNRKFEYDELPSESDVEALVSGYKSGFIVFSR